MPIRALIFDFGGVLMRTEDPNPRREWEARHGLKPGELSDLVFGSPVAALATVGQAETEAVWRHAAQQLDIDPEELKELERHFWGGDRLDSDLLSFITRHRNGRRTALLSNAWPDMRAYLNTLPEIGATFDTLVISAEEGVAKPDPEIYRRVLSRLRVEPPEAVFVDDMPINVEAARSLGMRAVQFNSREQVISEVEGWLDLEGSRAVPDMTYAAGIEPVRSPPVGSGGFPAKASTPSVKAIGIRSRPSPLQIETYSWRPARREDIPVIHRMLLAVDQADGTTLAGTLEDRERQFADPWSDPPTDSLLALTPTGAVAALAQVFVNPQPKEEARGYLLDEIHPEHRQTGLRETALTWLETRARERLQQLPVRFPRRLRLSCPDDQLERTALYDRRGFHPIRYFFRMRRDLRHEIPSRPLPEGFRLTAYRPELERPLLEAFNESFSDHWAAEPATPEDWQLFFLGRSDFRPDLTLVALQGDEIAGFCVNYVNPEENERLGIQQGWIGQLGVRRPWRRRGLASALLCESMQAFQAQALDHAGLTVDAKNLTGALGMYERLGFFVFKRIAVFEKIVD